MKFEEFNKLLGLELLYVNNDFRIIIIIIIIFWKKKRSPHFENFKIQIKFEQHGVKCWHFQDFLVSIKF